MSQSSGPFIIVGGPPNEIDKLHQQAAQIEKDLTFFKNENDLLRKKLARLEKDSNAEEVRRLRTRIHELQRKADKKTSELEKRLNRWQKAYELTHTILKTTFVPVGVYQYMAGLIERDEKWREAVADTWLAYRQDNPEGFARAFDHLDKPTQVLVDFLTSSRPPTLFVKGDFTLHSGQKSNWKIEIDALTKADLETLTQIAVRLLPPFGDVEGVPRGGLEFARCLRPFITSGPTLLVDDVLTSGKAMNEKRAGREDVIGVVIFAHGKCPSWITPIFTLTEERNESAR